MVAETVAADMLRTVKCFRLILLLLQRKYFWKKEHDLILILGKSLYRALPIIPLELITWIGMSVMSYHMSGGRVLVT